MSKLSSLSRVLRFGVLLVGVCCLVLYATGCSKPNTKYVIPEDIYGVTVPANAVWPEVARVDLPARGTTLSEGDFCLVPDEFRRIQLLQPYDVTGLEKVKEYEQESGVITEWREPNGNYKILTYKDSKGLNRVVGAITISKYITTGRGCRNQLTAQEVDALFENCTYKVDTKNDQESRIYEMNGRKLILTLKYDVVRSIQILVDMSEVMDVQR